MKRFLCRIFGHRLLTTKYERFNFECGMKSWVQECKRCGGTIYCLKGYVKKEPGYIIKTKLDNVSMEKVKSAMQLTNK